MISMYRINQNHLIYFSGRSWFLHDLLLHLHLHHSVRIRDIFYHVVVILTDGVDRIMTVSTNVHDMR